MFEVNQSVKFVEAVSGKINPNTGMKVSKRKSENPYCVWIEFAGLPALDNVRLVPLELLETVSE